MAYEIREYISESGVLPFQEWLESLETEIQQRIEARIFRLELGNLGDYKSLGDGVCEARLMFGPGYRIYFGIEKRKVILLLCGGKKVSQKKDIIKAKVYWHNYLKRGNYGSKKR